MAETEFSPLPEDLSPILDSLIDAVIILDTDGRIAGWNSVAEAARWRSITPPGGVPYRMITPAPDLPAADGSAPWQSAGNQAQPCGFTR